MNGARTLGAAGIATKGARTLGAAGIATNGARTLGAPGIATNGASTLGAPGIATKGAWKSVPIQNWPPAPSAAPPRNAPLPAEGRGPTGGLMWRVSPGWGKESSRVQWVPETKRGVTCTGERARMQSFQRLLRWI